MKTFGKMALCLALSLAGARGQTANNSPTQTGASSAAAPPPTAYHVIDRGASHRLWQRQIYKPGPNGKIASHFEQYQEVASGICYQENGQWLDSQDLIEACPSGSIAQNGPYKVIFAANLNSEGAINQTTPDHKQLRSNIIGLAYYDNSSGNNVLFAQVQDSQGELISSNQVLYPNAFSGIAASVRYTYKKGSFEQDVILNKQLPSPQSLGLNPDSTEIEVLTEYIDPPDAAVRENPVPKGALPDEEINWGQMRLGRGKAFDLGESPKTLRRVTVRREYANIQGRHILIEGVPFNKIKSQLSNLPLQSSLERPQPLIASKTRLLPKTPLALSSSKAKPMKMASALPPQAGYVLDYIELNSDQAGFTFAGDATYYVSGICNFSGTTTFEGGTIIKLDGNGQINIDPTGSIVCETAPFRPAIFTSVNDNSIGDKPDVSNGSPGYGDVGCFLNIESANASAHDMRFSYADFSLFLDPDQNGTLNVWNCQFQGADCAVYGYNITLYNALITRSTTSSQYAAICVEGGWLDAEQVTADGGYAFIEPDTSGVLGVTNSLITSQPFEVFGYSAVMATNSTVWLPSPTSPIYQTVGAGSYYLTNGSPYQNIGTPNINSQLLAELANLTTYPPVVFDAVSFASPTNFSPQAVRDNSGTPSIGYHYCPLDYVFGGCNLSASMTFSAGSAVGWFEDYGSSGVWGQPYGITINNGGYLEFDGTATQPCMVPLFSEVQEGGNGNWGNYGYEGGFMMNASAPTLQIFAKFTKWTGTPGWGFMGDYGGDYGTAAMADSEVYNENWGAWSCSYYFTNCLFFRMQSPMWDSSDNGSLTMQNCTVFNGGLAMFRYSSGSTAWWTILDTTFDGTAFYTYDQYDANTSYTLFDYNAYNTSNTNNWMNFAAFGSPCTNTLETVGPDDLMITNGYGWQTSYLGNFYLPPISHLVGTGSTTADKIGLAEFTTQTNQTKQGSSPVDIGYHYVAIDPSTSLPYETYTNNEYDYQADPYGNGLPESWELYWFGNDNEIASQLDSTGNNPLLYDYTGHYDPNVIQFSLLFDDNLVQATSAQGFIGVTEGWPVYQAVLVNDTNYADAVWQPYSSNLVVNLTGGDGTYNVLVGLRPAAAGTPVVWQSTALILNTTPAVLTVTAPAAGTVTQPMIQVQGFASKMLSGLTCDVSNAAAVFTGPAGFFTGVYYDTNTSAYTADHFQCYDVPLTNGLNTITLHATDLAGNVITTNLYYTLDYSGDTTPPDLSVVWPQAGTYISGSSFTVQAQVDDTTASVTAQIVDPNGDTNVVTGAVERDGMVWAQNLPLAAGANTLTLTATDAAGNTSATNLTVYQSTVLVTVDTMDDSQFNQLETSVDVTGTVSDPTAQVYVNTVQAGVNDDGTWEAYRVPVAEGESAVFQLAIYPADTSGGGGGGGGGGSGAFELPMDSTPSGEQLLKQSTGPNVHDMDYHLTEAGEQYVDWTEGVGGLFNHNLDDDIVMPPDVDGANALFTMIPLHGVDGDWVGKTLVALYTGGEYQPGQTNLYLVQFQLNANPNQPTAPAYVDPSKVWVENQQSGNQQLVPDDVDPTLGDLVVAAPSQATVLMPVTSTAAGNYSYSIQAKPITFQIIDANTGTNLSAQINTVIVGQQMNLTCQLSFTNSSITNVLTNFRWTIPGYAISNYVKAADSSSAMVITNFPLNNSNVVYYWVDGASNRAVNCTATVNGATAKGQATINVIRPAIDWIGTMTGTVAVDTNYSDNGTANPDPSQPPGLTWLHLGNSLSPSGNMINGVVFTATNENLYGYSEIDSELISVQLSTNSTVEYCQTNGQTIHGSSSGLDNTFPYALLYTGSGLTEGEVASTMDGPAAPAVPTSRHVARTDHFQMFLMFQDLAHPSIPVPLKVVDWNWSGSADTNVLGQWSLTSSNANITANNQNILCYPQWVTNILYLTLTTNNICN